MAGQRKVFHRKATIAVGATKSNTVNCVGLVLCGIITPGTVAGATLNLKADNGNDPLVDVYDQDGTQVALTMAASRLVTVLPTTVPGAPRLAIVSDVVASGAAEVYTLLMREIE